MNEIQRNAPPPNAPKRGGSPAKKKKRRKLRIIPVLLLLIIIMLLIGGGVTLSYVSNIAKTLPEWDETAFIADQTSFVYDDQGKLIAELSSGENRTVIEGKDVPQHVFDVLVANEDARFYEHKGVDVIRVFGALKADVLSGSFAQGASTLTMQVARNAILDDQSKKIERKIKEALLALEIEEHFSKDEILLLYLNEVFWGHSAHGIQAASKQYFDKDVSDLSVGEAAALIGMLPAPNKYSPLNDIEKTYEVRDKALGQLEKNYPEYADDVAKAKKEELVIATAQEDIELEYQNPWFVDNVISEAEEVLESIGLSPSLIYSAGLNIYTTMNAGIQNKMEEVYADEENFPGSDTLDPVQSAMTIMDPHTGALLGLIGGRDHVTLRGLNRAVDMKRQPGSVFKPIAVFSAAVEEGDGSGTVIDDVLTTFNEEYTPDNYDGKYRGLISYRTALQNSVNIASVRTLQKIGVSKGFEMAKSLGIPLVEDDKNLSLALGGLSYGVSTTDIAAAYSVFANEGIYNKPYSIARIEDKDGKVIYEHTVNQSVAMKETTAYIITNMLQTVTTSGTGTRAQIKGWEVASKTGTTQLPDKPIFKNKKGNKDAWFAAYTPEFAAVVWMGYDQDLDADGNPQYLPQVYGGKYPALIWKQVVEFASEGMEITKFNRPSEVISVSVDSKSGLLPGELTPEEMIRPEVYVKGTEPTQYSEIWETKLVCSETFMPASEYCPSVTTKLMYTAPEPLANSVIVKQIDLPENDKRKLTTTDAEYRYLGDETTCCVHTDIVENSFPVDLCVDPRHEGKLVLANIAFPGIAGGCPAEMIVHRNVAAENIPSEYCTLEDHQVQGGSMNEQPLPNPDGSGDSQQQPIQSIVAPHDLFATARGTGNGYNVVLNWLDDYNEPGLLYEIQRWPNSDTTAITTFETYFRNYEDTTAATGETYCYRIRSVDSETGNFSAWTATTKVTIPAE